MREKTDDNSLPADHFPDRPRNGKNHRESCACIVCRRIQASIAAGKPPKALTRAMGRQRRLARARAKPTPQNRRERRIAKDAALTGAIAAQAAAGHRPNIAQAARIAGIDPSQAHRKLKGDESIKSSIETALARAGITDEKLAQVAAGGLEAEFVKTATFGGQITDERAYADWHGRHKFWRDLLMLKGYLHTDDDGNIGVGGLMIINGPAQINTGHRAGCTCLECRNAWEEMGREVLAMQARREAAMNVTDDRSIFDAQESEDADVVHSSASQTSENDAESENDEDDWTNYDPHA